MTLPHGSSLRSAFIARSSNAIRTSAFVGTAMLGLSLNACSDDARVIVRDAGQLSSAHAVNAEIFKSTVVLPTFSGDVISTGFGLTLLAQVDSPVYEGTTLQATDVQWVGDRVIASYNVRDSQFLGALQVIDVSDPELPVVVAEAIYPETDVNRVRISGDRILAAAADVSEGGTLEQWTLGPDGSLSAPSWTAVGSFSATFLDLHDGQAWVSFGDLSGGVKVFDVTGSDPVLVDAVELPDARWVSHLDEGGFVAVAGGPARMQREAASGWQSVMIDGASIGAPTWALRRGDRVFLSSDEGGLQVMDLRDGSVVGELDTSGNANGLDLAVDGRLAFLANGQEGLVVADVLDPTSPVALASIDVADDAGSANAVSVAGDYLALADGLGGVKILRYDRQPAVDPDDCDGDGVPNDLDADDDDDGVLDASDAAPCDPDVVCVDGTRHHRARFVADFFNLPCDHPDVEGPVTGVVRGTLPSDFDWFTDPYYVFSIERDSLLIDYGENYFPVDTGLCQDPFHFAAHWYTTIIVDTPGTYRVEMGSDDDSWLFLDGELQIDLGGIHAIEREGTDLELTAGAHRLDIYFAERHVRQSGLEFEMVEFPDGAFIDFQESVCLDPAEDADGDGIPNGEDVAPLTRD